MHLNDKNKDQINQIDLVKGVDKHTGSAIWAYVLIPEDKVKTYRKKLKTMGGGFEQEGAVVLYWGVGETVPEEYTKKVASLLNNA